MTNPIHAYSHDTGCATITGRRVHPQGLLARGLRRRLHLRGLRRAERCSACHRTDRAATTRSSSAAASPTTASSPRPSVHSSPRTGSTTPTGATTLELHRIVYNGADRAGYPRPQGASPLRASLVPAYNACTCAEPHAWPAARLSVVQPAREDVAEPDDRHAGLQRRRPPTRAGRCASRRCLGDPGTAADEADVAINVSHHRRAADDRRPAGLHRAAPAAPAAAAHGPPQRRPRRLRARARSRTATSTQPFRAPAPRARRSGRHARS